MSLRTRIAVLLFVLMAFFSVTAPANGLGTFRLRIEDPYTGVGRVLTDNQTWGLSNSAGDQDSAPGTLYFSGSVENFNVTIQATTENSDGSGGGVLTLSARVTYAGISNAQIRITLEDSGYTAPAATAGFVGRVGGYNNVNKTVTPTGDLTGGASLKVQSWLDVANNEPAFGSVSGSTYLNSMTTPPGGSSTAAFAGDGQLFRTTGFAYTGTTVPVAFSGGNYSMFSQATVSFSGVGSANFSVKASDAPASNSTPTEPTSDPPASNSTSMPEPTSLMLLGSALLGLGFLPKKKRI